MTEWTSRKCKPCEGGLPALTKDQAQRNPKELPGWILSTDAKTIRADYMMKNFMAAVGRIQKIAEIAEAEGHHPYIHLTGYRKLAIELTTHAIGGLSENDFILAAKINDLPKELKSSS